MAKFLFSAPCTFSPLQEVLLTRPLRRMGQVVLTVSSVLLAFFGQTEEVRK